MRRALVAQMVTLPDQLKRSLTWDQGKEMAEHVRISIESGVMVYFCDPRSPWQRGTSEDTNGPPRQYSPEGTEPSPRSQDDVDSVAGQLNGRPRQTLGWIEPREVFAKTVAFTGRDRRGDSARARQFATARASSSTWVSALGTAGHMLPRVKEPGVPVPGWRLSWSVDRGLRPGRPGLTPISHHARDDNLQRAHTRRGLGRVVCRIPSVHRTSDHSNWQSRRSARDEQAGASASLRAVDKWPGT